MADFENGLPPINTDMTNKGVLDVSMQTEATEGGGLQGVLSMSLNTEQIGSQIELGIKSVVIKTEPAGKNLVMFYL